MRAVRWLAAAVLGLAGLAGLGEAVLRLAGFGHPILYDNRAAYGYRPLPDQTRRRFGGARVHVNNLGLRGADVTPERPPGALRILFLGDSVTWGGSYVDDAQLFATIAADMVRRRHPGRFTAVEALDAGVNGWGAENIAGLVGAEGEFPDAFGSDVWVLTILDDDFRREKTHVGEVPYFNVPPATAWRGGRSGSGWRRRCSDEQTSLDIAEGPQLPLLLGAHRGRRCAVDGRPVPCEPVVEVGAECPHHVGMRGHQVLPLRRIGV